MTQRKVSAYRICTGAHFFDRGIFSDLGKYEMSPVHFNFSSAGLSFEIVSFSNAQIAVFSNCLWEPSVEDAFIAKEQYNYIQKFIGYLPSFLQQVIDLHFYRGHSIKQISRLLNIPAPIVKNRLALSIYWLKIFVLKFKPPE